MDSSAMTGNFVAAGTVIVIIVLFVCLFVCVKFCCLFCLDCEQSEIPRREEWRFAVFCRKMIRDESIALGISISRHREASVPEQSCILSPLARLVIARRVSRSKSLSSRVSYSIILVVDRRTDRDKRQIILCLCTGTVLYYSRVDYPGMQIWYR